MENRRPFPAQASDNAFADKVYGCIVGGAVGDAFGYAIEFDRLADIRTKHGPNGLRDPVLENGRLVVSDDTQMTLFTAEGLQRAASSDSALDPNHALEIVRAETLAWFVTQGGSIEPAPASSLLAYASLWQQRAPGNTCLSACRAGAIGMPEAPINNSKGCGGVMRVAPIGLVPALSPEAAFGMAARAAAQTHGHPSGYIPAGVLAAMIRCVVDGADLHRAADHALQLAAGWPDASETIAAIEAARRLADSKSDDHTAAIAELGEGWVAEEALAVGLYAGLATNDVIEAIRIAANHDGDSDSTASIAGQIHGAFHGSRGIPTDWISRLDVLDPLQRVSDRFVAAFGGWQDGP